MRRWLLRALGVAIVILVAAVGVRLLLIARDLGRPERLAAWEEIRRQNIPWFGISRLNIVRDGRERLELRFDPRGTKLWLATGRDPNGHDCATRDRPPAAFDLRGPQAYWPVQALRGQGDAICSGRVSRFPRHGKRQSC